MMTKRVAIVLLIILMVLILVVPLLQTVYVVGMKESDNTILFFHTKVDRDTFLAAGSVINGVIFLIALLHLHSMNQQKREREKRIIRAHSTSSRVRIYIDHPKKTSVYRNNGMNRYDADKPRPYIRPVKAYIYRESEKTLIRNA